MAAGDAQIIAQAVTQLGKLMGADTINTIKSDLVAVEADVAGKADLVGGNEFSGAQVGPFVDKGGAVHNVRAYGAMGDGVTDDTAAINAAITAAEAVSGALIFPPGIYEDVEITADDITIIVQEGAVFRTSDGGLVPALLFSGCARVQVQGRIVADGNRANNPHSYGNGDLGPRYATVGFLDCVDIAVGDVLVREAWHQGIVTENVEGGDFGTLSCDQFHNRGIVLFAGTVDSEFRALQVYGPTHGAPNGVRMGALNGPPLRGVKIGTITTRNVGDGVLAVLLERGIDGLSIDTVDVRGAGNNGMKVEDCSRIQIGKVRVEDADIHGFVVNCEYIGTSDVTVGEVIVVRAGQGTLTTAGGVNIMAAGGKTTQGVSIGKVHVRDCGNATRPADGFIVQGVAGTTVRDISVDSIVSYSNHGFGVRVRGTADIGDVRIGRVIARDNGVTSGADLRIETAAKSVQIDSIDVGTVSMRPFTASTKRLSYGAMGGGLEEVIEQAELDLTVSGTWTNVIPAGAIVQMVHTVVSEAITFSGGGTQWRAGRVGNEDQWGTLTSAVAVGTERGPQHYDGTHEGPFFAPATLSYTVTPDAGSFASGRVRVTIAYLRPRGAAATE